MVSVREGGLLVRRMVLSVQEQRKGIEKEEYEMNLLVQPRKDKGGRFGGARVLIRKEKVMTHLYNF